MVQVNLKDVKPQVFRSEIANNPAIKQISFSSHAPASNFSQAFLVKNGKEGKESMLFWYKVDENFIQT